MRNDAPVKICLHNTTICFKLNREIITLSLKGKASHQKEKQCAFTITAICTPIHSKIKKVKGYNLRIIQEYFQPKIAGKNKNIQNIQKQHSYKNKRGYIKYPSVTDPLKSYSVV